MDDRPRFVRSCARLLAAAAFGQIAFAAPAVAAPEDDVKACRSSSYEASAIEACGRAIASGRFEGKELARIQYERGIKRRNTGDYDGAIADFTRTIALDPGWPWAYVARGHAYAAQKRFPLAFADQETAIRLEPTAVTYTGRGRSLMEAGAHDRALVDFAEALRIDPTYFYAYYWRGETYRKSRDFAKAEADFRKALELRPNDPLPRRGLEQTQRQYSD